MMNEEQETSSLRDAINKRFCEAVNYLLDNRKARNKNEVMASLGLYLGRLSLILGGRANASTDNVALLSQCYGVSTEWILLGQGPMMKNGDFAPPLKQEDKQAAKPVHQRFAGCLPLIPITALAGFNGIDEPGVRLEDCQHYLVPEFAQSGADFLIRIQGSSMTPTFLSGDLVACRKLEPNSWVDYGEAYVIDGQQGVMIKRVFLDPANQEKIICKSDNPDVPEFSITKQEIRSLAKVIGVVRAV